MQIANFIMQGTTTVASKPALHIAQLVADAAVWIELDDGSAVEVEVEPEPVVAVVDEPSATSAWC